MDTITMHIQRVAGAFRKSHLGRLYLIAPEIKRSDKVENSIIERLPQISNIPYELILLNKASQIEDHILVTAVSSANANIVLQIFQPDIDTPFFIFGNADPQNYEDVIFDIIRKAEELSEKSTRRAIINYANNAPDDCKKWISEEINNLLFNSDLDVSPILANTIITPPRGNILYSSKIDPRHKALMELFIDARANFVKYAQMLNSDDSVCAEEAGNKVDKFLNILTEKQKGAIFKMYLKSLETDDIDEFYNSFIDTKGIIERSKIKIIVEPYNDHKQNAGFYRLYFKSSNSGPFPLKFKHSFTNIVYLMLLIDRKNNPYERSVFSFEKDNEEDKALFVKLESLLYEKDERSAIADYYNMFTDSYGNQGRLKEYIKDIKDVMDKSISDFESPYPFIAHKLGYRGYDYFLPIMPSNIEFEESFMRMFVK